MKDLYEKLANDYDEFGPIDQYLGDEQTFFKNLFAENKVKDVLDCACGTGQHILMLSRLGYHLSGSDYSESMLEAARKNLTARNLTFPLYQCDFRYLERVFDRQFDAVICLTNSLPHLHKDEDLITALKSMRNRLKDNGLLVLTSGTTHYTLTLPSIEVVVNRPDFSRIFVKKHSKNYQTINIVDLFHTDQRNDSHQYQIVYRILLDEDYRKLLSLSGFSEIRIFGDYQMNPYNRESRRLIVVARK